MNNNTEHAPAFVGYEGDVNDILDPEYHQPDAGKRIRDAFVWAGDEFRRITIDSPDGTRMDFSRAKTPPPTPLAVQIAEHCAGQPSEERAEVLASLVGLVSAKGAGEKPQEVAYRSSPTA